MMQTRRQISSVLTAVKRRFASSLEIRQVIGNTGWLVAESVFRMLLGLVVGIWLARYLGPSAFGELNYALALVGMFSVVASLGIDSNIVRDIVRDPDKNHEILGTVFRLKLVGGVIAALLSVLAVSILRSDHPQTIFLVAIMAAGMVFLSVETISLWFQAQVQSKHSVYAKNLAYVLGALIRVGLIINEAPLIAFAWAGLVEASTAAFGLVLVYRLKLGYFPLAWATSWSRAKNILREGWPLLFSSISTILYMRLDMLMLGEISGDRAVGIYGVATRLSEAWYFLPVAIVSSLQPGLVKAKELGSEQYAKRLFQMYRLMAAFSGTVSLLVLFAAEPLVNFLYGSLYTEAGVVLALHVWGSVAVFLGVVSTQYLIIENLQKISLYKSTIGLVCNVVLNYLLIPSHGPIGAAVATLLSYFFSTFLLVFFKSTRYQALLMFRALFPHEWFRLITIR